MPNSSRKRSLDFHIHLTAWGNLSQADKDAYVNSFPACLDEAGLDKAVLFCPDNELTGKVVNRAPERLLPFAFLNPRAPDTPDRLEHYVVEKGFKGIKISSSGGTTGGQGFYLNDEACFPTYERAAKLGIPALVHTGLIYCFPDNPAATHTKYCQPIYLDDVARAFPNLKLVVAHGGRPFIEQTIALCLSPNVYIDLSWSLLPLSMWPSMIARMLEAFGPQRLIYGSDANWRMPNKMKTRLVEFLRIGRDELELNEDTVKKVLWDNAMRLLDGNPDWRIFTEEIRTQ